MPDLEEKITMTLSLTFLIYLDNNKCFQRLNVHPTIDGMRGVYLNKTDGKQYEVIVKPLDTIKCRLCGEFRPTQEILDNAGDCSVCALQQGDINAEDNKTSR